jgi:hypothetical protein
LREPFPKPLKLPELLAQRRRLFLLASLEPVRRRLDWLARVKPLPGLPVAQRLLALALRRPVLRLKFRGG